MFRFKLFIYIDDDDDDIVNSNNILINQKLKGLARIKKYRKF